MNDLWRSGTAIKGFPIQSELGEKGATFTDD